MALLSGAGAAIANITPSCTALPAMRSMTRWGQFGTAAARYHRSQPAAVTRQTDGRLQTLQGNKVATTAVQLQAVAMEWEPCRLLNHVSGEATDKEAWAPTCFNLSLSAHVSQFVCCTAAVKHAFWKIVHFMRLACVTVLFHASC